MINPEKNLDHQMIKTADGSRQQAGHFKQSIETIAACFFDLRLKPDV